MCACRGAGKSSLLGVLQAMYPASQGRSTTASSRCPGWHRRQCAISTTPSPRSPHLLRYPACQSGSPDRARRCRTGAGAGRVGLAERCAGRLDEELDKLQLSAGETQLLVIARILLSRRPLIVLDEATSDLDHIGMRKMAELLYRYRPEASYLVIAHHLEPLLSVDRVVVMEAGTVVEQGSPVSLLANSLPLPPAVRGSGKPPGAPDGVRAENDKGCPRAALVAEESLNAP